MGAAQDIHDLQRHRRSLERLARGLLADHARAEDAVQEAYLAAFQRGTGLLANPRAWLARVVSNRSLHMLRAERGARERELRAFDEASAPAGDQVLERIELQQIVLAAVRELREPYRDCVWMRYFDDRSPTEIARRLGLPVKTAKSRIARGRAELRAVLERKLGRAGQGWPALLALLPTGWRDGPAAATGKVVAAGLLASAATLAIGLGSGTLLARGGSGGAAALALAPATAAASGTARIPAGPSPVSASGGRHRARSGEPTSGTAALAPSAQADDTPRPLVPAGTINGALAGTGKTIIVQDDQRLLKQAEWLRKQLFPEARILTGAQALESDLSARTLIAYVTPEDPWLASLAGRLPFELGQGRLTMHQSFEGAHLRLICATLNPTDPERRAVFYVAAEAADLVDVNSVFHGPTEWLVADGAKTLDAGSWPSAALTPDQALRDLEFLAERILAVHPATAGGATPELERALRAARASLGAELEREDLWFVLNGVLMALGDAHSGMTSPTAGTSLDLPLRWLADGLYVDADTELLRFGDQVVSIGGRSEAELLAGLRAIVPAETDQWIRVQGPSHLRDLAVLRHLGAATAAPVEVVITRAGEPGTVAVPAGRTPSGPRVAPRPGVSWRIDSEHDLALFVLDRCQVDAQYLRALREFFGAVAREGIGRVAVDLRENTGGNSRVVDEFLRYLDVPSYRDYSAEVRVSEASAAQRGAAGLEPGLHAPLGRVSENERHADPLPYRGELFVLTSPRTFSSGSWFAVVLADNDLASVVGEPTGSAPSSFGDILSFNLPESGFTFTLSYKRFRRPDPGADPAPHLAPDVPIPFLGEHLRQGRDPVLEHLTTR